MNYERTGYQWISYVLVQGNLAILAIYYVYLILSIVIWFFLLACEGCFPTMMTRGKFFLMLLAIVVISLACGLSLFTFYTREADEAIKTLASYRIGWIMSLVYNLFCFGAAVVLMLRLIAPTDIRIMPMWNMSGIREKIVIPVVCLLGLWTLCSAIFSLISLLTVRSKV